MPFYKGSIHLYSYSYLVISIHLYLVIYLWPCIYTYIFIRDPPSPQVTRGAEGDQWRDDEVKRRSYTAVDMADEGFL